MTDIFILMKSEWMLCCIIVLLFILKLARIIANNNALQIIQGLLTINFILGFIANETGDLFGNTFVSTNLTILEKNILNLGVLLISLLFTDWLQQSRNLIEFFILMLSATLGMFFMVSSNNLLLFYIGLELASIPVAVLVNLEYRSHQSSEGAIKLVLLSAFSSALLLYGISMIYGVCGTINFPEIATQIQMNQLSILAFIFFISALLFKLSVVPFHLWTADVYQGAPHSITAYLSVISKAAVAFIFITILYKVFQPFYQIWFWFCGVLAIASIIIGNLFALRQQNIKRFLAYSSIAQIGYILLGICNNTNVGIVATVYFVIVYLISNLMILSIASTISVQYGKENIDDYKNFYKQNKFLSWIMALALFSLAGIPPTAGFFGKLFLLGANAATGNYLLLSIAALNMMISLFYYLKIVKAIFMDSNESPIENVNNNLLAKAALVLCSIALLLIGVWSYLYNYIEQIVQNY